eukprot:gene21536-biopygen8662
MVRGRIIRLWGGSQAGGQGGRLRPGPLGRGRTAGAPTPDISPRHMGGGWSSPPGGGRPLR